MLVLLLGSCLQQGCATEVFGGEKILVLGVMNLCNYRAVINLVWSMYVYMYYIYIVYILYILISQYADIE